MAFRILCSEGVRGQPRLGVVRGKGGFGLGFKVFQRLRMLGVDSVFLLVSGSR